jgi:acetyltransferase-like isoleucine patch superfamily enzyme
MRSESADVHPSAVVDQDSTIWDLAQVRENAEIASGVVIGRGAYIGIGVRVGTNSKIQNYALVYEPADIGAGVFIGPAAVLTNDQRPRAVNPDGSLKSLSDWDPVGVQVREGASIGARAVCVAPITVGRWSMVAAGAVVVSDVPDFALVAGVPARHIGWVSRKGSRLARVPTSGDLWECPDTFARYQQISPQELIELPISSVNS